MSISRIILSTYEMICHAKNVVNRRKNKDVNPENLIAQSQSVTSTQGNGIDRTERHSEVRQPQIIGWLDHVESLNNPRIPGGTSKSQSQTQLFYTDINQQRTISDLSITQSRSKIG